MTETTDAAPPRTGELAPKYDPRDVEIRLYESWQRAGYFTADPGAAGDPYSIVIPPPNVTGVLHIGHALNGTIQDILIRWRRMQGRNTLWLPGTDHAGIATQHVVERALAEEGVDSRSLGRDRFLERVWEWKQKHGSTITHQFQRLGCSCDWTRERFTMDEGLSRAVRLVFKRLFDEGLIYRGDYMVNWSPKLQTALSDDEVEHREVAGSLWHIRYPLKDGSAHLTVATTRPETMLGDTAVAVNPTDERYRHLIGKTCILPLMEREIEIIADDFVNAEFGTGLVKVTPAHDPNDYEMGKRHGLEFINILHPDGTLNGNAGAYSGLEIAEARRRVLADLEARDLLEKVEPHVHVVGHCYRSGCVVEPFISKQWFVKMRPLAEPAIAAVREGRTRIVPKMWENTYFQWLENVRDWCISRQLWWGHRIPVFTCRDCGHVECVIDSAPERCEKCNSATLVQDPDVLDTWFSSALWPFSTMGWPEKTPDLERYYPTSVLVTGHDIIFFWVARMMMMGLKFMGDVPFDRVYMTPLIMAEGGGKMSKSKGNAVDPLVVVERHGADSVRLTLASHAARARTVSLSMKQFETYRNFTNKVWNAARFVLSNSEDLEKEALAEGPDPQTLALEDRWILSQLVSTVERASAALEAFEFDEYLRSLYEFTWNQYCDWYLELVKPRLYAKDKSGFGQQALASRRTAQVILVSVLENVLRLLHPVAPFLTEEIWRRLAARWRPAKPEGAGPVSRALMSESIMIAPWPQPTEIGSRDPQADSRIDLLQQVVYRVRNIRGEMNVPPGMKTDVELVVPDPERRAALELLASELGSLLRIDRLRIAPEPGEAAFVATSVLDDVTVRVALPEDLREGEIKRLAKELARLEAELNRIDAKLANPKFLERAPQKVVQGERERRASLAEDLQRVQSRMAELQPPP